MSTAVRHASPSGPAGQAKPSSSTTAPVIRTGTLAVRERTAFGGRVWRSRGVVLTPSALTIHQPSRHIALPLSSITELERTDLMPASLSVKCNGKTYHFAFDSDSDLYDWQDDVYTRCPLGAQTTNPFGFQHIGHIGDGITGTFADPMYREMMGAHAVTPAAAAGRTPTNTQSSKSARRRSNPLQGAISLNNTTNFNIEGSYFVKQTGMFVGWYWKERWLSLKGASLIIHTRKTKASPPAKEIPLSTITSVEPDTKRSNCLFVGTTTRETCLYILFPTDSDLYDWREAIYLRSGLSSDIGRPTDFMHSIHVSYDQTTGELKGLPDQWKVDPSLVQPIVAKISMQTGGNNGTSRSSKRRSQPPPSRVAANEVALDLSSAIATAAAPKSAPTTPVAKTPVSSKARSNSRSSAQQQAGSVPTSSSPPFANLSRVPPPSAELLDNGAPGTSSTAPSMLTATSLSSQFSAGTSVESQNTLWSPVEGTELGWEGTDVERRPRVAHSSLIGEMM
ncbi:hypothetical protein FA13DRAFT_1775583 [Coprinellus micaceus]|uniref:CRIB domain-containing protein n=1 Tax=Coprinellus micaceus TaxID=71717 RepID=A0A4Y7T548_COPMI|nr:hypothetical protein FA13DRAFT_1775583 [Coprinellus micaceus]